MSALFNFHSFLTVVLLVICTCTYLKLQFPSTLVQKTGTVEQCHRICKDAIKIFPSFLVFMIVQQICWTEFLVGFDVWKSILGYIVGLKKWFRGFFWKAARIGERLSPWVAAGCFTMGVSIIFF